MTDIIDIKRQIIQYNDYTLIRKTCKIDKRFTR